MPENPFLYLQRNAERDPRGVFSRSANRTLTNADAVVETRRIAYELRRLGVRAGDVVALDLPEQLRLLFTEAVYHEAAVSTVLPPAWEPDGALEVRWLFTTRADARLAGAEVVEVTPRFLRHVAENPSGIRPSAELVELVRIVFSSGTTGRPKAIGLGREMEAGLDAALATWFEGAPTLMLMDTGTVWGFGEFFLSVKAGQPFLAAGAATPAEAIRLAEASGARTLKGSPNQLAAVVDELEAQGRTLPTVQQVFAAGTAMPVVLAERLRRATEGCAVLANYGSTEAGGATVRPYETDDPTDAGHPMPGAELEIVDERDVPVPAGVVGRIRYRTPGMSTGYLGDPEASARAFRGGWFYPGDLGLRREDGGLTLAGREDERINAGGVKVDPSRVDHAALDHPGVRDACGFAYDDESGLTRVGLAIVADEGLDMTALIGHLKQRLAAAAPTLVARVAEVPRTPTGKPRRGKLAELVADR